MRSFFSRKSNRRDTERPFPEVEETRKCPHCGGEVSRGATVCLYCEKDLVPLISPERFQNLMQLRQGEPREGPATKDEE